MRILSPGDWIGAWGTLAVFVLFGCASQGVPLKEVTDIPMALVYWDGSEARERMELMEQLAGQGRGQSRPGMASMDEVARWVGPTARSVVAEKLARIPGRIVLLNARTLEQVRFSAAPPNARPLAWSKDRKKMLFNSDHMDSGRSQIYEYDLYTQEVRKLTRGPAHHLEGDYGPEGEVLFTWIDADGGAENAGMKILSPGEVDLRVISSGFYPSGPRWSPREDLIVYVRADNRGGSRDSSRIVVRSSASGDEPQTLGRGRDAIFSHDGHWIVFASQGPGGWRLQRMRPDGAARKPLGESTLSARWPAISPDGQHVAYISNEDGIDRLYLRRMDGSGDRILLSDGGAAFPVW